MDLLSDGMSLKAVFIEGSWLTKRSRRHGKYTLFFHGNAIFPQLFDSITFSEPLIEGFLFCRADPYRLYNSSGTLCNRLDIRKAIGYNATNKKLVSSRKELFNSG